MNHGEQMEYPHSLEIICVLEEACDRCLEEIFQHTNTHTHTT